MPWTPKFPRYVSAAEKRARIERERRRFLPANAVISTGIGNKIASTFWGRAWCANLERYSDFENRLPRGRSYLRSGAVLDLTIAPESITAEVAGSSLYSVAITIEPLAEARWKALRAECAGRIESLVALLEGRLSHSVMETVTRRETGLFPAPREITLDCSCPDWADLCKHVAAVLYGVGVRLDKNPELLFALRGVDHAELAQAAPALWGGGAPAGDVIPDEELSSIFGIELVDEPPPTVPDAAPAERAKKRKRRVSGPGKPRRA